MMILFLLALLLPSVSWGAVAFDSTFEKGLGSSTSPQSFASNVGDVSGTVTANSNRLLIGYAAFDAVQSTIGTVTLTWDSGGTNQSMTSILCADVGTSGSVCLFGLKAPAAGNLTLQVAWTGGGSPNLAFGAVSLYNADQTTGWNNGGSNTGTGTSASSTVTTTAGDVVVVNHSNANATSTTLTQGTSAWTEQDVNHNYAQAYAASAGSSQTIAWTLGSSVDWANVKVNVLQAGGGGGSAAASRMPLLGVGP